MFVSASFFPSSPPPPPLSLPWFVLLCLSLFLLSHLLSFVDTDPVPVTPYGLDSTSTSSTHTCKKTSRHHTHSTGTVHGHTRTRTQDTDREDRRTGREATSWTDRRLTPGKTNQTGKRTHILTHSGTLQPRFHAVPQAIQLIHLRALTRILHSSHYMRSRYDTTQFDTPSTTRPPTHLQNHVLRCSHPRYNLLPFNWPLIATLSRHGFANLVFCP